MKGSLYPRKHHIGHFQVSDWIISFKQKEQIVSDVSTSIYVSTASPQENMFLFLLPQKKTFDKNKIQTTS